jgi:thioredoxin reductase (NADPH)
MILPEDLAAVPLCAEMSDALRMRLASRAADIQLGAGEWIAREGDAPHLWILLTGEAEIVKRFGGEMQQMTTFDPGEYFGEIELMIGTEAIADVRTLSASRLARIDPVDFHFILTTSIEACAMLAQGLVRRVNYRRDIYVNANATQVAVLGSRFDVACHELRDFLSRNQVVYEWLDPANPHDIATLPPSVAQAERLPAVIFADGRRLAAPARRELAAALDLPTMPAGSSYDVAIVGGGPAGLAAAVYGGSEGLRTIMIEREAPGGQAGTSTRIENYLGFPGGVSGGDLAGRALLQAKRFGTEILVTRTVCSIEPSTQGHTLLLDGGDRVEARAIIVASGVTWRPLTCEGAAALVGRGVYYGAARTEGAATRGKDIFLIGGGNSAGQAALFFSGYARSVTLLVRATSLTSTMSSYLIDQLGTKGNIRIEPSTTVIGVKGNRHIERITTSTGSAPAVRERRADALFVFIGADAETDWMPPQVERDAHGYIVTGHAIKNWARVRPAFPLETSVPGIFAVGDVRSESVKRVSSGVGEGSMAIAYVHQYLSAQRA